VNEALPEVVVEEGVPHRPLALHVGHPLVEADPVPRPPLVLAERLRGRADEPAVAGQHERGETQWQESRRGVSPRSLVRRCSERSRAWRMA
jgi:hypothetical protein